MSGGVEVPGVVAERGGLRVLTIPSDGSGYNAEPLAMSLSGAWRRLLRLPASPPDPSRPGGAPRRGVFPAALLVLLSFATVPAGGAAAQEVSFSSGTYRVYEGDVLRPELVLSHARPEDVTVRVEALDLGSAASGDDFAAGPWQVTVPTGKTRQAFDIAVFDDDVREDNEEFLLHVSPWGHSPGLRRSSGGNPDAVAVIKSPTRIWLHSPGAVWEGETVRFEFSVSNPKSRAFNVDYTLSGGTASAADVVGGFGTRSVTVPAYAKSVKFSVRTAQDTVRNEGVETFSVQLSTSEPGIAFTRGTADVSIHDVDTPRTVTFESASSSADEGAGTHHVTLKLSPAPIERIRLNVGYAYSHWSRAPAVHDGNTATPGSDYEIAGSRVRDWHSRWSVWVDPGETTVTVPVTIVDDGDPEGDETVVLRYKSVSNESDHRGKLIPRQGTPHGRHTLTIVDNDVAVSFATASQSVLEASGTHGVTVNLTAPPASGLTVRYTVGGTATAGSDFTITNSGTLTVPAGARTATIPVALVDDGVDDAGETVVLTLAAGEGYDVLGPGTHTLHIDPVPTVRFAHRLGAAFEGGEWPAFRVPVRLQLSPPPAEGITLHYTVGPSGSPLSGTPTPGLDYEPLSGKVQVPAGAREAFIPVTVIDDSVEDSGEVMTLTLSDRPDYTVGSGGAHFRLYIFNHETGDLETLVQARLDAAVADGEGTSANLWRRALAAVRGEAPPDGLSPLTGAEAEALADEHAGRGEVELASLWSEIARVIGDGATNPPPEPAVTVAAGTSPVTEGGDAVFTLTANPAPAADLSVTVTVASDGDWGVSAGNRTVTIPTSGTVTLTLATTGDNVDEPDGSVSVTVTDGTGYTVGTSASGTVSVQDDDDAPLPEVTVAAGTSPVTEGGDAVFTLAASPAPAADLSVTVTVAADGDWGVTAGTRTVTIPTSGSATLTLATSDDSTDEPDGSVTVTVNDGNGYTPGSAASGSVAVQDDDAPPVRPVVTLAAGTSPVTEGGDAVFTLTASPAPAADLPVTVTVATDGDWGVAAGTRNVTIPTSGSATLTLATTDDSADEPDGSVSVTVADGQGYTVGASASGTVSVQDDDDPAAACAARQSVAAYLIEVRDNPENAAVRGNPAHVAKWNRVLEAIGHDTGTGLSPMPASEIHGNAKKWPDSPFKAASDHLDCVEAQGGQDPAVTVTADAASVTEGGDAVCTLTASPAPAADLSVTVTVASDGDWGITAGTRTVTIPTTGSATLTLATADDAADEPDGSVTVTVKDGNGYTPGSAASGSITIEDDDAPLPEVTLAAGTSPVTEGGDAVFTLTANPAPAADLSVSVTVATDGDWGVTAGSRTVTIPTTGSAKLTLATSDDSADEPDGSVTATVQAGSGYTVGASASVTVAVRDDDLPPPVVTIAAKAASVAEGGDAVFTLTATPAPAADLPVTVTVATDGDWGVSAGTRTVTIPTSGSATLTLATTDDAADEPDGSVTVTVADGSGYTVGATASGTVAVRDDDLPPPVVTIAAKAASVTEGGDAVFTLTADRAPDSDVTVTLAVSETGDGDHVAAADEGPATLVIPKGATEAAFAVATVDDEVDEPDGTAVVAVTACAGCTAGDPASASVTVKDDDAPSTLPALSVGDSTAKEGARLPIMPFTVRLSPAAPGPVRVYVSTLPSTPVSARPGQDYAPGSSDLTFRAGETEKVVWIRIYDDSHDEGAETFEVVLSEAKGAVIGDGVAVGTITNDDPMPAAFLARFGRTVAEQALDGIAGRMSAPRTAGMRGTLAGQAVGFGPTDSPGSGSGAGSSGAGGTPAPGAAPANGEAALAMAEIARGFGGNAGGPGSWSGTGSGHDASGFGASSPEPQSRTMTARDALLGSSFSLTGQKDGSGGSMTFWGRASQGSFDGREGTFSLDGEVTTALLGADYARGRWLIGLALAQSTGEGDYRDTDTRPRPASQTCPDNAGPLCDDAVREGDGRVEASLTAALPYASVRASERWKLWGAVGVGAGEVTLKTALGGRYKADTTWRMAAAGVRGALLGASPEGAGPALAVTSDALWTRTSSEKTAQLAASASDATRLRLGLEGSWRIALDGAGHSETEGAGLRAGGASLVPKLELGARHDGGDAETGFGVELGGGLKWTDPGLGLTLDVSGRTLLAHENDALKDRGYATSLAFDPDPATERGPSFALRQELGARADGGLDALFAPDPLEDRTGSEPASRWGMEAAYGVPAFGGRFTGSPHVGLGLSAAVRDYTLGWRWTPEAASTPDLSFGFKATRRGESDTAAPEHAIGFEVRARW